MAKGLKQWDDKYRSRSALKNAIISMRVTSLNSDSKRLSTSPSVLRKHFESIGEKK